MDGLKTCPKCFTSQQKPDEEEKQDFFQSQYASEGQSVHEIQHRLSTGCNTGWDKNGQLLELQ